MHVSNLSASVIPKMNLEEAYAKCTHLAETHYENFPVGKLVPAHLRRYVHAVYAFARVADDYADEGYVKESVQSPTPPTQEERTAALEHFESQLTACIERKSLDPETEWIFLAVADTIQKKEIPPSLLFDLLSAFKQDVVKRRYANHAEVLDYCRRSANPVGRLVLHLHGYHDEKLHLLSDHICTALQLANFWQDVSVDLLKDRIYIPQDDQMKFGLTEKMLFDRNPTPEFINCLKFQVERAWAIFNDGRPLPKFLKGSLGWEIRLTWLGGTTILKKIEKQKFDTLSRRPKLSKWDMLCLMPVAWFTR